MNREIKDLSIPSFASEILHKKLEAICKETDGVLAGEDIEYVHRMRVACRRFRTALTLFEDLIPAKPATDWKREVKRLTKALGAARDTDVQIAFLKDYSARLRKGDQRTGLARLELRLEQKRARQQKKVRTALDRFKKCDLPAAVSSVLADETNGLITGFQSLQALARQQLLVRLDEVLVWERVALVPSNVEEQHAMRIAAKHLRYALEIFMPLSEKAFTEPLKTTKTIQELLGQIHDCDVWIAQLPEFLEDEKKRMEEYLGHCRLLPRITPQIERFRKYCMRKRNRLHRSFVQFWLENKRRGVWTKMRRALEGTTQPISHHAERSMH